MNQNLINLNRIENKNKILLIIDNSGIDISSSL